MSQADSEFRQLFLKVTEQLGNKSPNFIVCSSNHEFVWSCGFREKDAASEPERPGFKIYGMMLNEVYKSMQGGHQSYLNAKLLESFTYFGSKFPFRNSALVLSDSICRNIKHIDGGHIFAIGGAVFSDIVNAALSLRLNEFGIIIVNCGVNVARRLNLVQEVENQMLEELLSELAALDPKPEIVLPINFINWWDNGGYPFVENGAFMQRYLRMKRQDNFHLGPSGIRVLREQWCECAPALRRVAYTITAERYKPDYRPPAIGTPVRGECRKYPRHSNSYKPSDTVFPVYYRPSSLYGLWNIREYRINRL